MKKLIYTLVTVITVQFGIVQAQSARLQVIHNAADNNASVVDIYLKNGSADSVVVKLDNFAFRDATPYVSVPAGDSLAVIIAGPDSDNEGDQVVATVPLGALSENETYAAIANGVLNPDDFTSNPDGREIGFELLIKSGLRETGQSSNVDFIALHGATDAPTVDIMARNVTTLVNDAAYTDITEYVDVPPASYTLDVTPGSDNSTIVASFDADLSGLGGGSAIVFASGFLTPADNQFGPAFGIFAALANGDVVEFPAVSKARLQVIHNSADVAADPVDIYLRNGSADSLLIKLNDFAFRTATPFVDVPADDSLSVIVALSTSSGEDNGVITTIPLGGLKNGETYVALASGVVDSSLYASNPDNIDINFEILVTAGTREMSETENVEFIAVHGATDAPTVKISARDVAELVPAAAYRDITDYIGVPAGMYTLDVSVQSDITNTPVASFMADLSGLGGGSAVVFASGFLSPASNQDGEGFGLFAALANGDVVPFPSVSKARLQVIHNAADIVADPVDIYLKNGTADSVVIKLDDFAFRSATPFVDVPAGDSLAVIVAGPSSADENSEVVAVIPIGALQKDEKYVAIANGLVTPNEYAPNPDGRETAFELLIKSGALESTTEGFTSFSILHGSTDAPTVDIFTRSGVKLANNAGYTDMTEYISVNSAPYIVDLTASDDSSDVYVSHDVNLSGLSGQTAIVFASGFINSDENKNGPGFGLYAALANGTVAQFPEIKTARLQVIHNAADIAADPVDIYLRNGDYDSVVVKLDDFAFRTATPFVDVPAGDSLSVEVAGPSSSESGDQVIAAIPVGSLLPGATYTVIANGVVTPDDYKANPEGRDIAFQLLTTDSRESGNGQEDEVMFKVLHGATDAPAVDIIARDVATLVDGAAYTDITPYVTVDANKYILDITPDEDNDTVVASFVADLSGLGGGVAFVFASGFLSPSENQNGPAFGIYAVLTDGTVVEFPAAGTARLQVIHNAADIAADPVDIYLKNGTADSVIVKLDDFQFREATPYVTVPAGDSLSVIVAAPSSMGETDGVIATIPLGGLMDAETYVAFANGVVDTSKYAQNPDGRNTAFQILVKGGAREEATSDKVDFFVLHGSTDAPTVDIWARGVAKLVEDAAYTDITDYISVPAASYTLDITPGNDSTTVVVSYEADLSSLDGGSAVVFASGFFDPAANQNGPAFGIFAALGDGQVVQFATVTSVEDLDFSGTPNTFALEQNYPNPFNPSTTISFSLAQAGFVTLKVYNVLGQEVATLLQDRRDAGSFQVSFDASNLSSGLYFYRLETEGFVSVKQMMLVK